MRSKLKAPQTPRLNPWQLASIMLRSMASVIPEDVLTRVLGMIRARDLKSLCSLGQIEDREYQDPDIRSVLSLRQIACLFKKNDAFADESRCKEAARKSFEQSELVCRITNRRLDHFYEHPDRLPGDLRVWLERMRIDIESLLGDVSEWEGAMPNLIRLTSGATEDRSRRRAFPFLKITGRIRAPLRAVPYIGKYLLEWGVDLANLAFRATSCNRIALVSKNWETHRTIAAEPTHTLPFQLSLDSWLKRILRKWKVDLRSQRRNQELARLGSLDGSLATLDLKSASDRLAYNAVAWLLPLPWLNVFDSFRSTSYRAPWGTGSYAKYSSMGNGYTFTLETLIFTAAVRAVGSRQYAVYGDDIILESSLAPSLVRLLRFLGFTTNDAKSFTNPDSRFRESCGSDYYRGVLVTPFYLRELPKLRDRAGMSHVVNGVLALSLGGLTSSWVCELVKTHSLPLVPYNEDTRSGVFVTPNRAWATKILRVDRRRWLIRRVGACPEKGIYWPQKIRIPNPDYGFPVYDGLKPESVKRATRGYRSYLLWFLEKNYGGDRSPTISGGNRTAERLLDHRDEDDDGLATRTSSVSVRSRYVHGQCRYDPKPHMTPSHLYVFDDEVLG